VTYAEIRGYATGLAIKVAGADHAELVDSIFWDVVRRSS